MFVVNESIRIPEQEFEWTFVRASGPGGQNVNKVASKAVLRWNVARTLSLREDVKSRLFAAHRSRINVEGELILSSQRFRDQGRNIEDCLEKLRTFLQEAAKPKTSRRATRPTRASKESRLQAKKRRSSVKSLRRRSVED